MDEETRKYLDAVMDAILIRVDARFSAMETGFEAKLDAMEIRLDAKFAGQQARFNDGVERLLDRVNRLEDKE